RPHAVRAGPCAGDGVLPRLARRDSAARRVLGQVLRVLLGDPRRCRMARCDHGREQRHRRLLLLERRLQDDLAARPRRLAHRSAVSNRRRDRSGVDRRGRGGYLPELLPALLAAVDARRVLTPNCGVGPPGSFSLRRRRWLSSPWTRAFVTCSKHLLSGASSAGLPLFLESAFRVDAT